MSEAVIESVDLREALEEMQVQLASLAHRVAGLEQLASMGGGESAPTAKEVVAEAQFAAVAAPTTSALAAAAGISEEEVLAISGALAAWLGVHAHIRQIRLIRTGAWAQQGRVTIQASHTLSY